MKVNSFFCPSSEKWNHSCSLFCSVLSVKFRTPVQFFLVCGTQSVRGVAPHQNWSIFFICKTPFQTRVIENTSKDGCFFPIGIGFNLTSVNFEFGHWQVVNLVAEFPASKVKSILNCSTTHLIAKLLSNQISWSYQDLVFRVRIQGTSAQSYSTIFEEKVWLRGASPGFCRIELRIFDTSCFLILYIGKSSSN